MALPVYIPQYQTNWPVLYSPANKYPYYLSLIKFIYKTSPPHYSETRARPGGFIGLPPPVLPSLPSPFLGPQTVKKKISQEPWQ